MDVIVAAYGSSAVEEGAAHVVYGTNTSTAYHASYLDLGSGGSGGLDGIDGFTLTGIRLEAELYATLVSPTCQWSRQMQLLKAWDWIPVCCTLGYAPRDTIARTLKFFCCQHFNIRSKLSRRGQHPAGVVFNACYHCDAIELASLTCQGGRTGWLPDKAKTRCRLPTSSVRPAWSYVFSVFEDLTQLSWTCDYTIF